MCPAAATTEDVARLSALSGSPYPPEPPRRSRFVEAFMRLVAHRTDRIHYTPHYGGTQLEMVQYEYEQAPLFWTVLENRMTLDDLAGKDVLDVGCGWGGKMTQYAENGSPRHISGFDLPGIFDPQVAEQFASARGVANCTFTTGVAESIPFGDEEFDVLIMEDVLEHVSDPEKALTECLRVLRPGGVLAARFPSIRMANAHHFDRAAAYPGLHYLRPIGTWAAGLNHYLLHNRDGVEFEPFSRVVLTKFHPGVTNDLNGMDVAGFRRVVDSSGFVTSHLGLVGFPREKFSGWKRVFHPIYAALRSLPPLREPLSRSIIFIGTKPISPA